MATQFIQKVNGATDATEIADDALGRQRVRNLPTAAGLAADKLTGKLKYNKQDVIVNVVTSDDVEVAAVDDVTLEYSGGVVQVKDEGIDTAQIADEAVTSDKTPSTYFTGSINVGDDEYVFVNGLCTEYVDNS